MKLSLEQKKQIQKLREIEGKKLREIAEIMGCNINTVSRYCLPYEAKGRKQTQREYYLRKKG